MTYDSPDIVAGHAGNVGGRDGHPSKEGVYPWREEGKHDGALTHDGEASFQVRVNIIIGTNLVIIFSVWREICTLRNEYLHTVT